MATVILLSAVIIAAYFIWGRPWAEKQPVLAPIYSRLDTFYTLVAQQSRLIFLGRTMQVLGALASMNDIVMPAIYTLMSMGVDVGAVFPGGRWIGPFFYILGQVMVYLRKDTNGPVNKE